MSQADTVLQMLRDAGPRGVHTFEIYAECIANPSQRIAELEKLGHTITSVRERPGPGRAVGARYKLTRDAEAERAVSTPLAPRGSDASCAASADGSLSLFDMPAPRPGVYDRESDAA